LIKRLVDDQKHSPPLFVRIASKRGDFGQARSVKGHGKNTVLIAGKEKRKVNENKDATAEGVFKGVTRMNSLSE